MLAGKSETKKSIPTLTFRAMLAFIFQLSQVCDTMKTSPVIHHYDMGYARMVLLEFVSTVSAPPCGGNMPRCNTRETVHCEHLASILQNNRKSVNPVKCDFSQLPTIIYLFYFVRNIFYVKIDSFILYYNISISD